MVCTLCYGTICLTVIYNKQHLRDEHVMACMYDQGLSQKPNGLCIIIILEFCVGSCKNSEDLWHEKQV